MNANVVIKLLTLIEMGFELSILKKQIQEKEASGATNREISQYIDDLYEDAIVKLTETE